MTPPAAKAALDLYFQHRPQKPIVAVIYTHSHTDHYGGVKGIISEADVKSGKVQVIALQALWTKPSAKTCWRVTS